MQTTGIEYLSHTWNPIAMRCTRVSPGCTNCWHLRTADRLCENSALPENERAALAGTGPFILRGRELSAPLRARKPAVIGVQFMGDLFHEAVPEKFRNDAYNIMCRCKQHVFLILTKRPHVMHDHIFRNHEYDAHEMLRDHIYHGLTVCNQQEWDAKKDHFLAVPGKKFISHEPALGIIDYGPELREIAVLIAGGETGAGARPTHPDVCRSDRDQCTAVEVRFCFKQWGEWAPDDVSLFSGDDGVDYVMTHAGALMPMFVVSDSKRRANVGKLSSYRAFPMKPVVTKYGASPLSGAPCKCSRIEILHRVGREAAGRLLDGRTHDELPWRAI